MHLIGRKGVGRTGLDTTATASATIFGETRVLLLFEFHGRDDDAEEEPRAEFFAQNAGVFAGPAYACIAREKAFYHGAGIDEGTRLEWATVGLQAGFHALQTLKEYSMIVAGNDAAIRLLTAGNGIPRDPALRRLCRVDGKRHGGAGIVVGRTDDYRTRPGKDIPERRP